MAGYASKIASADRPRRKSYVVATVADFDVIIGKHHFDSIYLLFYAFIEIRGPPDVALRRNRTLHCFGIALDQESQSN